VQVVVVNRREKGPGWWGVGTWEAFIMLINSLITTGLGW